MLIVEALIVWTLLLILAYGLGVRVARWLRLTFAGLLDIAVFAIGLGFGCIIGTGFALGAIGWLKPPIILAALGGLAFISIPSIHLTSRLIVRPPQQVFSSPDLPFVRHTGWVFLAVLIVINLVGALAPEIIWDAHSYHLNLPQQWLNAGRLVHVPYMFYSTWPLNLSILYAVEMSLIPDSILPQLTHLTLGVLSMLLIYNYLHPRYGATAAICGGVIFYSIPAMSWLSTTAISDLGVAYFTLAAVIACLRWMENGQRPWLILAALETGLAMGAKLTGLFTLALLALVIVYIGFTRRESLRHIVGQSALVIGIALVLASPWYLKSYFQTGNPIFPFGYTLFGGTYWTDIVNSNFLAQQFSYAGIQRTPLDYLLLPLRLLIPQRIPHEGPISGLFLVGVIWGFVQRRNRPVFYLTVYVVITFSLWMFFTTQLIRMLLPVLGTLSIVLGVGLSTLASRFHRGLLIVTSVMLLIMGEGAVGVWRERPAPLADQIRVVFGSLSRETFLRTYLEPADVLLFANRNLPPGGAILSMLEVRSFLSEHEFIWGDPSTQAYIDYPQLKDPGALRQRLSDIGIQYLLLTKPAPELELLRPELQLIYKSGKYDLYRWESNRKWVSDECYAATAQQEYCLIPERPQAIVGEIVPGTKLFQTFTSKCSGLNRIKLFLTSYDRVNTSTLRLRLKDMDAGQQWFDRAIPAAEIANNQWHEISFEPLPDSKGKHYRITLASPDAEPGNAFGVWHTGKDTYPDGAASINNDPIQADWVFQYGCEQ